MKGPFIWKFSAILMATLFATALAGCGGAEADEHDHLEHHAPAHKPASYRAALVQIECRLATLRVSRASDSSSQVQELVDIVRWLPELAGDSDLPEEPWNRVNAAAKKLLTLIEPALRRAQLGQQANLPPAEQITPLLAELNVAIPVDSSNAQSEGGPSHG